MEPFAVQRPARSRAPWVVVAGVFSGFMVWQFNIIPHIRSAATGSLVEQANLTPVESMPSEFDRPWDEIVDRNEFNDVPDTPVNDPLMSALARQTEPLATDSEHSVVHVGQVSEISSEGGRRSMRDSRVQTAGYELAADTPSSRTDLDAAVDVTEPAQIIPAELAEQLRRIDVLFRNDQIPEAHAELSRIYWKKPQFRGLIKSRLEHTASMIFVSSDRHFEEPRLVEFGDTLGSIAKAYNVSWQYLARLNRTTPDRLQAGQQLKVVTGPFSAVVDLEDYALTVHAHGWFVHRYRIGIGQDNRTPTGEFTVQEKLENPVWYNPEGGEVDADDPLNPLGEFWLGLGNHIGIHGTIDPQSIGAARSRGCIHLADGDIEEVFNLLTVGSKVLIRE